VHNSLVVEMLDGGDHLSHQLFGVVLSQLLCFDYSVEEFTSRAILHYDMYITVVYK